MKLILAVSADGFTHRNAADDMRWTGATDKNLFILLTNTGSGIMLAGSTTHALMSREGYIYRGRRLLRISHQTGETLPEMHSRYPDAWLIGGPATAAAALNLNIIDAAYICHNSAMLRDGVRFTLQASINSQMALVMAPRFQEVGVYIYKLKKETKNHA